MSDGDFEKGGRPLVSFCIKFFNHRKFCREALLAAFRQTYSPLEIIVTDDGSTDGTAAIVSSMIDEYVASGGKHSVVKLFNATNVGITKTAQRQFKAAQGELLVQADGDDISFPNRVEKIVQSWVDDGCRAGCIVHEAAEINFSGTRKLGVRRNSDPLIPLGAASAYHRRVVADFSDIDVEYKTTSEDMIYSKRGLLVGGFLHIPEQLVYYRIGSGLTSRRGFIESRLYTVRAVRDGMRQIRKDLDERRLKRDTAPDVLMGARRDARCYALRYYAEAQLLNAKRFRRRWLGWKAYAHVSRIPLLSVVSIEWALIGLPSPLFRSIMGWLFSTYWAFKRLVNSKRLPATGQM